MMIMRSVLTLLWVISLVPLAFQIKLGTFPGYGLMSYSIPSNVPPLLRNDYI